MHGLGNDFVIFDMITHPFKLTGDVIRKWSDRNTGIGFDQLLAVHPPNTPEADFRFQIYNADGTEAQQCGNGIRCFAKFVVDSGLTVKKHLLIETLAGVCETHLLKFSTKSNRSLVEVNMGIPSLDPAQIPFESEAEQLEHLMKLQEQDVIFTPLSMGNPHAVIFVSDIQDTSIQAIAHAVQTSPRFPNGVNVGFLQVIDQSFGRLRVIERGVGETLACGTGACAAAVAGILHNKFNDRVKLSLPGGKIKLSWKGHGTPVRMEGPAELIYKGEIQL